MKILAIGAHPDDIEIFMYGFLSVCKNRGDDIFLCVATDGSKGGIEKGKKLVSKRKKEAIQGLKKLGEPKFLGFIDGELSFEKNAKKIILDYISEIKPDLLITHAPEDYHRDHKALSDFVVQTAGFDFPVLFADTLMGVNFTPNFYVDITDHFEEKKKAILAHKTQNPSKFFKAIKLCNRFRSAQCNFPDGFYAEAYRFEPRFPFVDIRSFLPENIKYQPYYTGSSKSFI